MQASNDFQEMLEPTEKTNIIASKIEIQNIKIGQTVIGENVFSANVINKTSVQQKLVVKITALPGLWFSSWKDKVEFDLAPGINTQIACHYQFSTITPEASITLAFGVSDDTNVTWIKKTKYFLGEQNPAVNYDLSHFELFESPNFEIHCFKGSLAEKNIDSIIEQRETAAQEISTILGVSYPKKIRIFYYNDYETKKEETRHMGEGWAFSNIIIEIYNEQIKLDPYHELAHIYGELLGTPPALIDEGFAVYISEYLGADALKYMGASGETIFNVTRQYHKKNELFPLEKLLGFLEIGSTESKPAISYPQSASIVQYLIETCGFEKFQRCFKELGKPENEAAHAANMQKLEAIYGLTIHELESNWLGKL